ncbi:MAG: hypothetical protein ACJ72W_23105 [Actinoallomurus sp.]
MLDHLGFHSSRVTCLTGNGRPVTRLRMPICSAKVGDSGPVGVHGRPRRPGPVSTARAASATSPSWIGSLSVSEHYTDEQPEMVADYLRQAAEVGRDQARRLSTEAP